MAPPPQLRRRHHAVQQSDSPKARLLLALACLWPLIVFLFFGGAAPNTTPEQQSSNNNNSNDSMDSIRNLLDRVDILGYGPTHPRVAVVVVGDDRSKILSSVESVFRYEPRYNIILFVIIITCLSYFLHESLFTLAYSQFSNTDLNRLFVVCAVMDGVASDPELVSDLQAIDAGAVPHWHGLRPDVHAAGVTSEEEHGRKVHVLFSKRRVGVAASRNDAVDFIQLLQAKHEQAGLKSTQEDLILLMLQPGAQLTSHNWLGLVTPALIVPPPILKHAEETQMAMKLSNAVSFPVEGAASHKATSFDYSFAPVQTDPSAQDMSMSNGMSFPTPVLQGAATAMRLDTFFNLASLDETLTQEWQANLDLSLNLWLCADGIDVLTELSVKAALEQEHAAPLTPKEAARFAAAWMDGKSATNVYYTISETHSKLTRLEWETNMSRAKALGNFAAGLQSKCRPFSWYAQHVNTELVAPEWSDDAALGDDATTHDENVEADTKHEEKPVKTEKLKWAVEDKKDESKEKNAKDDDADAIPPNPHKDPRLPSTPIPQSRLDLLSTAKPMDLTYVDMTNGFKEFPHRGAKDEEGNWGYVHDETALRKNPPEFEFPNLERACARQDNHRKMLTEKVFVDLEAHEAAEKSGKRRDTIFCLVYTISTGHDRIPYIRETWGSKCDGFMVGSNKTDASINAVNIPHEGPEEYNNIWQKVRTMVSASECEFCQWLAKDGTKDSLYVPTILDHSGPTSTITIMTNTIGSISVATIFFSSWRIFVCILKVKKSRLPQTGVFFFQTAVKQSKRRCSSVDALRTTEIWTTFSFRGDQAILSTRQLSKRWL